jgi:transposase
MMRWCVRGGPTAVSSLAAFPEGAVTLWGPDAEARAGLLLEQAAHLGIDLEIVQRHPVTRGFHIQPRRWVIERTLGWLTHHRRLARDYETLRVVHDAAPNPSWATRRTTPEPCGASCNAGASCR